MIFLLLLGLASNQPIVLISSLQDPFSPIDIAKWQTVNGDPQIQIEGGKQLLGGFNQETHLFRIEAVPPHYLIRVEASAWIYNKWNNTQLQCFIDKTKIASQSTFSMFNNTFKQEYYFNVINVHDNPTIIIRFKTSKSDQSLDLSWGIRNIIISYYPCPIGCDQCKQGDTQEQCQKWQLKYNHFQQLSLSNLINEGWKIQGGDTLLKYTNCVNIPLFGLINKGQKLIRTFYLDSHYRIKIKFLFFKIDNWGKSNFQLFIDDQLKWTQLFDNEDSVTYSNLCLNNNELDDFIRVELEFDHIQQFTTFYFTTQLLNEGQPQFGIRDFQIFIIPCQYDCSLCTNQNCISTTNVLNLNDLASISSLTDSQFTGTDGWTLDKTTDIGMTTLCNYSKVSIFGGYGTLGQGQYAVKTYKLSPHRIMMINLTLYILDSFDTVGYYQHDDRGYIALDGGLIYNQIWGPPGNTENFCGNLFSDRIEYFHIIINHSSLKATLALWTDCDQDSTDESFGFRDIYIQTGDCDYLCNYCNTIKGDPCEVQYWKTEYKEFTETLFVDAEGWYNQKTAPPSKLTSLCDSFSILGGFNSMNFNSSIHKTMALSIHNQLRVQLTIFLTGKWQGEQITLYLDDQIFFKQSIQSLYFYRLCDNTKSTAIQIDEIIYHESPKIKLSLTSTLQKFSSSDCGFGIRDVQITPFTI